MGVHYGEYTPVYTLLWWQSKVQSGEKFTTLCCIQHHAENHITYVFYVVDHHALATAVVTTNYMRSVSSAETSIANCMYVAGKHDIRACSSHQCNDKTTSQRKNWRIQIRTIYNRSTQRPCFRVIPCIHNMSLKKSGYRAVSPSVVSTNICTKIIGLQKYFIFSRLRHTQCR